MSQTASQTRDEAKRPADEVPVKTIVATIGILIATYLSWLLFKRLSHILELIVIAVFLSLVLNPAVDLLERRLHMRRGLAATFVFIAGMILFAALMYLFIRPLVDQTQQLINRFPQIVQDAKNGKGTVGHLVTRYKLDTYVREHQAQLRDAISKSTGSIVAVGRAVVGTIVAFVTVLVLVFMMLLYGREMVRLPLIFFSPKAQSRITRVANDAAKAVTGYTVGNLLISLIAAVVTFVDLTVLNVGFPVVLAVWVGVAGLIPLVGATLGAIPTIMVAFLHSPTAGIVTIMVYIVYQQLENHLIQTAIMSRTVNLNPLVVFISALIGVDMAGLLGALLAIPIAGAIQVIGRDLFYNRHRRLKGESKDAELTM